LYGGIGFSRKSDLAFKSLKFKTMSSLIRDYCHCYSKYQHTVAMITIGLPVSHNSQDQHIPQWYFLKLNMKSEQNWIAASTAIDKFSSESLRVAQDYFRLMKV
jgi:hypothetical protein